MHSTELHLLVGEFFQNAKLYISDETYALPNKEWILNDFYDNYSNWLFKNGLKEWKEDWDCDSFASAFYVFAQMCHAKTQIKNKCQGLAIGELFFKPDSNSGHAVNLMICENSLDNIYIIEPQNGKLLDLTETQRDSAWFIRF